MAQTRFLTLSIGEDFVIIK